MISIRRWLTAGSALAWALFGGGAALAQAPTGSFRNIYYYQTQFSNGDTGTYVSLVPMWKRVNPATKKAFVTDVIIAALHFGYNADGSPYIHLNDFTPEDPHYAPMWPDVRLAQKHGLTVHIMIGGSAPGTFSNLFAHFDKFYPLLKQTIKKYHLQGIDLDVEESVTLANIESLIKQIHTDFGPNFLITMAPVATDLTEGYGLSGFSYHDLYKSAYGKYIAWFNVQFYSGFGSLETTADYDTAVANGYPADIVVAGPLDSPNDGDGYVPIVRLSKTVKALTAKYPNFGGVVGWEYFNAEPGGTVKPISFAVQMGAAMTH